MPAVLQLFACRDEGARVTALGALIDSVLGSAKLVVGLLGGSVALVADGLHSLSDAATDLMVIAAHNLSRREPTAQFAYGFHRAETLGVLLIGLLLGLFSVGLLTETLSQVRRGVPSGAPAVATVAVAAVCLVVKEAYYHLSLAVGRRLRSQLLVANAHHSRTDVYTSALVLAGLLAARYGWYWIDPALAVLIAGLVLRMAWRLVLESVHELMDVNLPAGEREALQQEVQRIRGVVNCHGLRGRRVGRQYCLECRIGVTSSASIAEGHQLARRVQRALRRGRPELLEVVVHVEPARDQAASPLVSPSTPAVTAMIGSQ